MNNKFEETLKHTDDMIAFHADQLAIARLKKELVEDLIRCDIPSSTFLYANFLKAAKQGLPAADRFMKKYRCI